MIYTGRVWLWVPYTMLVAVQTTLLPRCLASLGVGEREMCLNGSITDNIRYRGETQEKLTWRFRRSLGQSLVVGGTNWKFLSDFCEICVERSSGQFMCVLHQRSWRRVFISSFRPELNSLRRLRHWSVRERMFHCSEIHYLTESSAWLDTMGIQSR